MKMWKFIIAVFLLSAQTFAGTNTGIRGGSSGDGPGALPIGFEFNYYGNQYTEFYPSIDGLIGFTQKYSGYTSDKCTPHVPNTLYVFWDYLFTYDYIGANVGQVWYQTIGEAPNRKLIVQWNNVYFFRGTAPMGIFQAILYEGSDAIKYQYVKLNHAASTGTRATIAISGNNAGETSSIYCRQENALHEGQSILITPNAGRTAYTVNTNASYEFTDIAGGNDAPTPPRVETPPGNSITWIWSKNHAQQNYEIYIQTEDGNYVHSQVVGNVDFFTLTQGVEHGKSYVAKLRGQKGSEWSEWSELSNPVQSDQLAPDLTLNNLTQVANKRFNISYTFTDDSGRSAGPLIQVSSDAAFNNIIFTEQIVWFYSQHEIFVANAPGRIYVRLIGKDIAGNQTISNVRDLVVVEAPVAAFDMTPAAGEAVLNVAFTNQSTGTITSYKWDFGNGKTSTLENPSVRYTAPGNYLVILKVSGSGGAADIAKFITVTPDNTAPAMQQARLISGNTVLDLTDNPQLLNSAKILIKAEDKSTISRVVFSIGDDVLGNVIITNPEGFYEQDLNILSYPDGIYDLRVDVYDIFENLRSETYPITISLAPPVIPTMISPESDITTNQTSVQVSGFAVPDTEVMIAVNSVDLPNIVAVDSSGNYSTMVDVAEGLNKLTIKARYSGRTNWSAYSDERSITVNTQIPDAPKGFSITAAKQGQVHLQWNAVTSSNTNNQVKGYKVYRSSSAFTNKNGAGVTVINNGQLITSTNFTNTVAADGNYFYAVAAVNQANNEGALSTVLSATADSIGPKITQLTFTTEGEFDTATATFGRGRVIVNATFSEPLRNAPYFAVVPEAGLPVSIDLAKSYSDEKVYTGQFTIDQSTASGTAYATMSAFDNLGNRGTDIQQNGSLKIDTQGPDVAQLSITPGEPLKIDSANGLHVNVSIRLSEATKAGTAIKLVPMINGSVLTGHDQGIALVSGAEPLHFVGEFDLPNTVAQSASAQLSFAHTAVDELNNTSQKILGKNLFQVYQGDLPPLNTPGDLTATALPGGKIKLNWRAVEKAAAYVLYRQGPNDAALIALPQSTTLEYEDATTEDGTYLYAVASVRRDNGQESESGKSATVSVKADRVAPAKAENLALELNGAGIVVRWTAPALDANNAPQSQQGLTYTLYRTALPQGAVVTDASAYTPIQTKIPALIALDTKPASDQHSYFVVAVDAAGNESAPSATAYLNAGLLPVNQLFITLDNNGYPQLSWQHQGNGIESYRVLRKTGTADAELLTPEGIAHNSINSSYTDNTYNSNQGSKGAAQEVVYSVIAVDEHDVESVPHELRLPALSAKLERNKPVLLERGVMNQLWFRVDNKGTSNADGVRLYVTLTENGQQREHSSDMFSVAANANQLIPIVIGGYDKLDAITDLSLRLEQKPQTNQRIRIQQTETVDVGTSSLTLDLSTQHFTRGGAGKVSFNLTNNSDVETELVMATDNSNADSTEVRLILEDLQGNLLTQKAIRQTTGGVINVTSGHTVARVAPKSIFSSEEFTLNIPAVAPDQVRLRLVVDKYHYQLGKENHVAISGIGVSKDIQLNDTPYFAIVSNVQPATVNAKNGTVTISGRAVDRTTNQPIANVPVSIVTSVRGFERINSVYSDANGDYVYAYQLDGTAGKYRVSAIHPEMTDRPNQGEFVAEGGSVSPADIDMKVPRNYGQKIHLRVRADQETNLANVRLVQLPNAQQTVAELPAGVSVSYQPLTTIVANSYNDLILTFIGDNSAVDTGLISYRVEADNHTGTNALGTVNITYQLSASAPAIKTKPAFVDTGVGLDQTVYEDVVVTNSGLDLLRAADVELVSANGSAVPEWVRLSTANILGDIPVGESRQVQIIAEPKTGVSDGIYEFKLNIKGANISTETVQVFIKVTQSGKGKAFFKISDIYTATKDASQQIIEGVNKARIQIQNEKVLTEIYNLNTDAKGEALFENIPAGRYAYRASANDHNSVSGHVWIKPDVTNIEKVFLMNNLVNVEWSVREINVEDRYEINLEATFKTNVPAPVVVLKPMAVNLPVMKKGDVFQGEFTLTNHGLIRAYNLQEGLPVTNDLVRFEFLKEIPSALEAGQVFTLPYRIQALRDFNPASEAAATGGGCGSYAATYSVIYQGRCVNETVVGGQTTSHFNSNWGSCGGGAGSGGAGAIGGGAGGGSSGVSYSYSGTSISSEPEWCIADTECDDCNKSNGSGK